MLKAALGILIIAILGLGTYFFRGNLAFFQGKTPSPSPSAVSREPNELVVGIGSMILPSEGKQYYADLANWLGDKTGKKVTLVFKKSYKEMNDALKNGEVDLVFVCGQPYVEGKKDFNMELLVAPVVSGKMTYHSYIIVPKGSKAKKLSDLRGKTFAFTDPISNTGKLVPTYMLGKMGETSEKFFSKVTFSGSHDASIYSVANGQVDGAAVDSLIWDYLNKRKPGLTDETKIIETSPPYGIPPVVVRPNLDASLKAKLQDALLSAHLDNKAQTILKNMDIERFSKIDDSAYSSIREMINFLGAKME